MKLVNMEQFSNNIFFDSNTEQYYILKKPFEKYTYYYCVVKSCQNSLKLMHDSLNKITKNEHNHTAQEGKNIAAILSFKARLKEMAVDPAFGNLTPKNLLSQAMNAVRGVTFPPDFQAGALKLVRNKRFRSG